MADYFSAISHQPLSVQNLPESVRTVMQAPVNTCNIPHVEEWEVWDNMKKGKKTKSTVPGKLPARLRHEFGLELAVPATIIFNKIATSGQWPDHWKEGWVVSLKKVDAPKDESEIRLIEITSYLSHQMERIVNRPGVAGAVL